MDKAMVAILGSVGWYEKGTCGNSGTYSRGPLGDDEITAGIRIRLSRRYLEEPEVLGAMVMEVINQPILDLLLPEWNVRHLFEGCIGYSGDTSGHAWDGDLGSLHATDSVGLRVYMEVMKKSGAIVEER